MNVIKIKNLSKEYQLGIVGTGTLYRDIQSFFAKVQGKPDPNSIIGSNKKIGKGKFLALNNINLEIKKGEILGIIGHNGAGKSTLLKIISRITLPSSGEIRIKGKISSLLEVGTGFHPELTGRENIFLNAAINGMKKKETETKINSISDFAGVQNYLDTPVKRYSTGMRVRLGFAVAVNLNPDIFIIDEVLAVGDASFQKKALHRLEELTKNENKTILLVSHNLETIRHLCNRVVLLENGKIKKIDTPNNIIEYYSNLNNTGKSALEFSSNDSQKLQQYFINNFFILNNNNEKSIYLNRQEPFQINVNYVIKNYVKYLSVNISILTASEQNGVIYNTSVLQWSDRHFSRLQNGDEIIEKKEGNYQVKIDIPKNLLNAGKYRLNVRLINDREVLDYNKDGIVFELYDIGSPHLLNSGLSSGLIAMNLNWNEKKIK